MIERVQIGEICFLFDMPIDYSWQLKDIPFIVKKEQTHRRAVKVTVIANENLEEPINEDFVESGDMRIWHDRNVEVRSHRALFGKEHAAYAISTWQNEKVDIHFKFSTGYWNHQCASIWSMIHLESQLLLADSILLHCCYMQYKGEALLFTAPSGTGKTTQGNIWKKVYGSQIVNGDLAVLQKTADGWDACGFPLSGSADECENLRYPIKAVVIVRQSLENHIEELSKIQQESLLYSESYVNPWNADLINKAFDLLSNLVRTVPVIIYHCNMEDKAAQVLHNYLF